MAEITKNFTTEKYVVDHPVGLEQDEMRLDSFVQLSMATLSRQHIKRKITKGEVRISNRPFPHKPCTKIHYGEIVTITTYREHLEDVYWLNKKIDLIKTPEIIYDDNQIVAISKPPFMATHPTGSHLFYCATVILEQQYRKIHSIHRLDRETSGVLLLGKNPNSAMNITEEFTSGNVKKCYFLIAHKTRDDINYPFTANERLEKSEQSRIYIESYPENSSEGKHATTHFDIVHQDQKYAICLAFPQTGRQHQIRVHAATHGLPLLGDKLYHGGYTLFQRFKENIETEEDYKLMQIPRHALHSIAINFPYFKTKERLTIQTKIPYDLCQWIQANLNVEIDTLEEIVKNKISNYFKELK